MPLEKKRLVELLQGSTRRGAFELSSGKTSEYYLDCRQVTLNPDGLGIICNHIWDEICRMKGKFNVNAVGGPAIGCIPIVSALVNKSSSVTGYMYLKGFFVRDVIKNHGLQKKIEGLVKSGDRVIIIDDVITSGKSALEAAKAVMELGCEVNSIICVVDRLEGAKDLFNENMIPFHPMLTIEDLGIFEVDKQSSKEDDKQQSADEVINCSHLVHDAGWRKNVFDK